MRFLLRWESETAITRVYETFLMVPSLGKALGMVAYLGKAFPEDHFELLAVGE